MDETNPGRRLPLGVYRIDGRASGRAVWVRVGDARREPRAGGYVLSLTGPVGAGEQIVVRPLRLGER